MAIRSLKNCHSLRLSDSRRTLKEHRCFWWPALTASHPQRGEAREGALVSVRGQFPVDGKPRLSGLGPKAPIVLGFGCESNLRTTPRLEFTLVVSFYVAKLVFYWKDHFVRLALGFYRLILTASGIT